MGIVTTRAHVGEEGRGSARDRGSATVHSHDIGRGLRGDGHRGDGVGVRRGRMQAAGWARRHRRMRRRSGSGSGGGGRDAPMVAARSARLPCDIAWMRQKA